MATTGTAPAREQVLAEKTVTEPGVASENTSLGNRILRKLHEIFQYNEELGVTRL